MNMVLKDKLKALRAKSEVFRVPDTELDLTLTGLTFSEVAEMAELAEKLGNNKTADFLLKISIRKAIPTEGEDAMTDKEVDELVTTLGAKQAADILQKVQELSGIKNAKGDEKNLLGEELPDVK